MEQRNTDLKSENEKVTDKYHRLKLKVRQRMIEEETVIPVSNYMQLQRSNYLLM